MKLKNKGITLIALVITIIILLILTGVVLNLTIGENGIINLAKRAGENYLSAELAEQEELKELYKELGIENLPENTKENPQDMGKEVALKDGWGMQTVRYTNTKNGVEVKDLTKVATVYAVSVGNGDTVPVPKGFYYVGGTLADGVIISDNEEDQYDGKIDKTTYEYTRNLKGNQFVWIPCRTDEYKKCDTWNGTTQTNTTLGNNWWDKTTPKAELSQIEKYGGFYVARYEAGLASTVSEYTSNIIHNQTFKNYNIDAVPQSKAGIVPWNFIDWDTSKKNAESMYSNNYVSSGLITGTQWDVMLKKMVGKTIGETTGDSKVILTEADLINSLKWGNHMDNSIPYTGRLARTDCGSTTSNYWTLKPFGGETTGTTASYNSNNGDLLTTGASKTVQVYHIYDLAGNLWEWTEEVSHYEKNNNYRVSRGGSYINASGLYPACYRNYYSVSYTALNVGFRVVLYIK